MQKSQENVANTVAQWSKLCLHYYCFCDIFWIHADIQNGRSKDVVRLFRLLCRAGRALGYRHYIIERGARIPLMPVSGEAITEGASSISSGGYQVSTVGRFGSPNYGTIYRQAQHYMMYGPVVVDYSYWDSENDNNSTGTDQTVGFSFTGNADGEDAGYAQNLIQANSGFDNYPSGFEFLDPKSNKRMTLSMSRGDQYTTEDDEFTYDTTRTPVTMQNYSRFIISDYYWGTALIMINPIPTKSSAQSGQVMVFALILMIVLALGSLFLFDMHSSIRGKIKLRQLQNQPLFLWQGGRKKASILLVN